MHGNKKLFMESIFIVGNFLTTCTDHQLITIRENAVIELFVTVLASYERTREALDATKLVLEAFGRLFEFDWTPYLHS